jgi:subtilisin family serine protease
MADHLRLFDPVNLGSKRVSAAPRRNRPSDRPRHATTLAGVLAGLGLPYPANLVADGIEPADDLGDDVVTVLVFTGEADLNISAFRRWGMEPLAEGSERQVMVLSDQAARTTFARLVETYGGDPAEWTDPKAWLTQLDLIAGVRLYGRQDRRHPSLDEADITTPQPVDVLVWPSSLDTKRQRAKTAEERVAVLSAIVDEASQRNPAIHVMALDPRPDTTLLRIVADESLLDVLLDNELVERVRLPLRPEIQAHDVSRAAAPDVPPVPDGESVGVIDDLVTDNPMLANIVTGRAQFPTSHVFAAATGHGTGVAGIAAYGDLRLFADSEGDAQTLPHPIVAARIMEADPHDSQRAVVVGPIHLQMEEALHWLHQEGIKVVCCSIGEATADDSPVRDEWTSTIDTLARELDLVIVVAAGNVTDIDPHHWRDDYPDYLDRLEARIAAPGCAVNALTVGAKAARDVLGARSRESQVPIARAGEPSPFTRTGPARARRAQGAAKPEFVADGGNWGWDHQLDRHMQRDPNAGVLTLAPAGAVGGRTFAVMEGTSVAAPFVAHQVAAIATRYPKAGPNLLRCLTALSADGGREVSRFGDAILSAYGEPRAQRILESGPHRLILTYEGEIDPKTTTIHELPIPAEFARGAHEQRLTVALAYDPPVRRTRRDYTMGELALSLVRNIDPDDLVARYSRQPTTAQAAADPALVALALPPGRQRPELEPRQQALRANTLVRQTAKMGWDEDDDGYFVVLTDSRRAWAEADHKEPQRYALAVELSLSEKATIDLYALAQLKLRTRTRLRVR